MSDELKPCPFCGGDASPEGRVTYSDKHKAWWCDGSQILISFYVNCMACGCSNQNTLGHQTKASAISAWNTRADLTPTDAQIREHPKVVGLVEALGDMMAVFSADAIVRKGAEVNAALSISRHALAALAQPQRCAECDCEHGGTDCNWIVKGPEV